MLEIVFDDADLAQRFVASLSPKIRRQRFSSSSIWKPDHTAIALLNERPVAMADCVVSVDGQVGNVSLLAARGCGAWAVKALLALKRHAGLERWESTLRVPAPATVAISRRYCESTYDQAAWEMAGGLAEVYGPQDHFRPVPLFASDLFLRHHQLPQVAAWDQKTRDQLLSVCADPKRGYIKTPSGLYLHSTDMMALAFDILKLPMDVRQNASRLLLASMMAMLNHDPTPLMGRHINRDAFKIFLNNVKPYAELFTQRTDLLSVEMGSK